MTEYAYIARQPCGAITGASVDNPEDKALVDRDIAGWIRDGRTVERMTLEEARVQIGVCPKDPARRWKHDCLYRCPLEGVK